MHARPPELQNFFANPLIRRELEELLAVISKISLCAETALHAISSHQFSKTGIADHQMVADEIITIAVEADASRTVQPLAKLAIKDQIAQALAIDQVFQ